MYLSRYCLTTWVAPVSTSIWFAIVYWRENPRMLRRCLRSWRIAFLTTVPLVITLNGSPFVRPEPLS